jgi:hypothetical protein
MEHLAPHCIVEIENRRFDSWSGKDLISSSIELTTDKTGEATVELLDINFKLIDSFLSGGVKPLQARFWYGWDKSLGSALFVGSLARVEWSDGATTLRFHDFSSKMKQQKKARYHKKKSDLKILKDLAEENGLKFVASAKIKDGEPFDSLMQSGKTDWEFAMKVAERSGLRLYVRGNTLFAVEAGKTGESAAAMALGKDFSLLRGFNLSYKLPENKKGRPHKSEVRGRGRADKQLKGSTETGQSGTTDVVVHEDLPNPSIAVATRRAVGKSNRRREYAFEHQLKTMPSFRTIIEVRNTLTLAGMGKFFSGKYVVTDIRYNFRAGELTSELTVGRDILK